MILCRTHHSQLVLYDIQCETAQLNCSFILKTHIYGVNVSKVKNTFVANPIHNVGNTLVDMCNVEKKGLQPRVMFNIIRDTVLPK